MNNTGSVCVSVCVCVCVRECVSVCEEHGQLIQCSDKLRN